MKQCEKALKNKGWTDVFVRMVKNELCVKIQDGPIKEVGQNGVQVADLLELVRDIFIELNMDFPCKENGLTIEKINEAMDFQTQRTTDRNKRGVEGLNKL